MLPSSVTGRCDEGSKPEEQSVPHKRSDPRKVLLLPVGGDEHRGEVAFSRFSRELDRYGAYYAHPQMITTRGGDPLIALASDELQRGARDDF